MRTEGVTIRLDRLDANVTAGTDTMRHNTSVKVLFFRSFFGVGKALYTAVIVLLFQILVVNISQLI